jgi:predicted transcriptional regulator of viral defense system
MIFDELVKITTSLPVFDMATIVQLSDEPRKTLTNQLYRWNKSGKVIQLRKGMYTLADRYRRIPLSPANLANLMYRPSYISLLWALSFYGLIPEAVPVYTCVTTRTTRQFRNTFGRFSYRNIKQDFFFGYHEIRISGNAALIAVPEKALLDLFHLSTGEWNMSRMTEMRFQQTGTINRKILDEYSKRMGKPGVSRAVETWIHFSDEEKEGAVEL